MKKRILIIMMVLNLLMPMSVCASNECVSDTDILALLEIVEDDYFTNSETVTREECIIAIMRVIGVTDAKVDKLYGADLFCFVDTSAFSYFGCAYLGGIAYGEECVVDYPTYRTSHTSKNTDFFFFPERLVTVKETLAFMNRCLGEDKSEKYEFTIEHAKAYGLIEDTDLFAVDENALIDKKDFCALLKRMLYQKRYKYYSVESDGSYMEGNIDKERSMTYIDFLCDRKFEK